MKYQRFIFRDYEFNPSTKKLHLYYSFDGMMEFSETFFFDFDFSGYDEVALNRACQMLFYMAGVSYYKAYVPPKIDIEAGEIDKLTSDFLQRTYEKGLGEFFYVNKLDPRTKIIFPDNISKLPTIKPLPLRPGLLVGIGGGKDSLVSIELLRKSNQEVATWSVGHRAQLTQLVKKIGLPHFWVERTWDRSLLEHAKQGAYNGHIPISAIYACVGTMVSILSGYRDVVVSNEQSANEPTLRYDGLSINHQYSKSQEFENDYQKILEHLFGTRTRYYSFLRSFSELRIAEIFSQIGFEKYKDTFSSCNRAFVHTSDHMSWCGECPKCAFTFLALTPFVERDKLEKLWGGKNLLLDASLETTYKRLLGIEGDKPLDCVGEIKESRAAMKLAQAKYPELNKYSFDLPNNYDYRTLAAHSMPSEQYQTLKQAIVEL